MLKKLYIKYLLCIPLLILGGCAFSSKPLELTNSPSELYSTEDIIISKNPSLNEYLLYAIKNSSNLRSSFNLYNAALKKAPQVSILPEPVLTYGYFISSIETRVGPMQHRVGLSQPIPWFGKLSLRGDIANIEAKAAYYSLLVKKNTLVADIIKAYYELAYLHSAIEITEANLELLKRWEEVLSERYRSQLGSQANLIKVQVELGKLEDKLIELKDLATPLKADFNSLLNRPVNSNVIINTNTLKEKNTPQDFNHNINSHKSLELELENHSPELKLLKSLAEAREKGIKLARKDYYPDFSIGGDYTFIGNRESAGKESGSDGLAAILSLSIPINFSKYEAGVQEAKHKQRASEQLLTSRTFQLKSQLARNVFNIKDSKRKIGLFAHTLIPKSEEALESTFTAFESGESDFLNLLDTERELLNFQLMLSRAQADLFIKSSELRALLGDFNNKNTNQEK